MSLCGDICFGNVTHREDIFQGNGDTLPRLIMENFQGLIDENSGSSGQYTYELNYSTVLLFKQWLLQKFANVIKFEQIEDLFDYSYQMMYKDILALEKAIERHNSVRICWSW